MLNLKYLKLYLLKEDLVEASRLRELVSLDRDLLQ